MSLSSHLIAVIADTHGLLRPEVIAALDGCEQILHAGDVGKAEILAELNKHAPVTAVRGNVDTGEWAKALPITALVEIAGQPVLLLHKLFELDFDPAQEGIRVVVSGHSHRSAVETRNGILYLNPGSAGPRRFGLPVSVAHLRFLPGSVEPEIIELPVG